MPTGCDLMSISFNKKIEKKYNSVAYTTILEHERISNNVAVQIFTKNGPLAFLPISDYETSIVYSVNTRASVDLEALINKYNTPLIFQDSIPNKVISSTCRECTKEDALSKIRLIMLVNDVSLRNLIPNELAKGFGFFQSKPSTAFSPVAVTPDELGPIWQGGKVNQVLEVDLNGEPLGRVDAGIDMTFNFGELISHACKSRNLGAGTIIGSGTVSNRDKNGGPGKSIKDGGLGYSCIAEIRMVETILEGKPKTPFMKFGDTTRIEMKDKQNNSIFGKIEQQVKKV